MKGQSFDIMGVFNYGGVWSMLTNPASSCDNLLKLDVAGTGINFSYLNNGLLLDLDLIRDGIPLNENVFFSRYVKVPSTLPEKLMIFSNYDILLPSLRYSITDKLSAGIFIRRRFFLNIDNLNKETVFLTITMLKSPDFWFEYKIENFRSSFTAYNEFGLNFSSVVFNLWQHFFKAGFNFKVIYGLGNLYAYSPLVHYHFSDSATLTFKADVHYGHSRNFSLREFNFIFNPSVAWDPSLPFVSGAAPALDLGIVYEFRPFYRDFLYEMDGNPNRLDETQTKYLLKASLSLLDLGSITFTRGIFSGRFLSNIENWDIKTIRWQSIEDFDDTLRAKTTLEQEFGKYIIKLPATIVFSLDIKPLKSHDLYLNYTGFFPFMRTEEPFQIHSLLKHVISIRGDWRGSGIIIPLVYYPWAKTLKPGIGFHAGPFWLYFSPITLPALSSFVNTAEIQGGFSIPIYSRKPPDRDGDRVSDKMDECPDKPGLLVFHGCPDTDGDGVEDRYDKCPTAPGLSKFQGCPDTDGDGIFDLEDDCIYEPGPAYTKGCPDRDGDSVIDRLDQCPDVAGLKIWDGCPDTDGDGIPDNLDECPRVKGTKEFHGCPPITVWLIDPKTKEKIAKAIRTEEGIFFFPKLNLQKRALFMVETPEGESILWDELLIATETDTGLAIVSIKKTKIASLFKYIPPAKRTLKTISEEEAKIQLTPVQQKIVEKAMQNLRFNYNSAVINPNSYTYLDSLATLLLENKSWKIRLEGHTDNIGSHAFNLELSKRRAEAVARYLLQKGISQDRIEVKYYGETRPIAPNDTEENRAKNRRVEMIILSPQYFIPPPESTEETD